LGRGALGARAGANDCQSAVAGASGKSAETRRKSPMSSARLFLRSRAGSVSVGGSSTALPAYRCLVRTGCRCGLKVSFAITPAISSKGIASKPAMENDGNGVLALFRARSPSMTGTDEVVSVAVSA